MMNLKTHFCYLQLTVVIVICHLLSLQQSAAQIKNFDKNGQQITRFSTTGDAIDAHDGEIAQFNGIYYLYGTSYDCGFQWGNKGAPFCGFKVYSSTDLLNWVDKGFLFDAKTQIWQTRCDGKTYGCFRPHVIYNKRDKRYVLWINVYDNVIGYRVFTSKTPTGPFTEMAEPKLAVNNDKLAAGLNNGDHDTFVDDDGSAYLAYTDWRSKGSIVIEKLSDDYLTGTGEYIKAVTPSETEAPGMFKRKGKYYIVYSDPNCGYCSGTGTSYRVANSLLGPWSEGKKISDNSCGGQPSFVSTIKINSETVYLYGSDLWNNAAKNEALANYYWAPLTFAENGSINPLNCTDTYSYPKAKAGDIPAADNVVKGEYFRAKCSISADTQRSQSFTIKQNGVLSRLSVTAFKGNNPDKALILEIYAADSNSVPTGKALCTTSIPESAIGWSAKNIWVKPMLQVKRGQQYALVLRSETNTGCYGIEVGDLISATGKGSAKSVNGGKSFKIIPGQSIRFKTFIKASNK